jgi:prepilin-type N-terminal cleavage/methylation domain-containing protein
MSKRIERSRRRAQRGLSLLEVMIGLALTPIVLAGIHSAYRAQAFALKANNTAYSQQELARATLDLIAREVRMSGYDPSGLALVLSPGPACPGVRQGLLEATPNRLNIRADLDGDGLVTGVGEDVVYELDLTLHQVRRTDAMGSVVLLEDAPNDGLVIRYFDTNNPPVELVPAPSLSTGERDCVGSVHVVVRTSTPNPDPQAGTSLVTEASSQVAIRSRALMNF